MALNRIYNDGNPTIDILSDIGEGFFTTGFTMSDMNHFLRDIGDQDITVNISSLGGDVNDALVIYDLMKMHKGKITANILGATASSGTVIAMGADYVRMSSNALFLVHNTWTGAVGNADDLRAVAADLDKFDERIIEIYKKATGRRAHTIEKLMKEERWIDANEAFEFGFINEVFAPAKAAAGLDRKAVAEKIKGQHKLPPIPENFINNENITEMELKEQLANIMNGITEIIKGKEKEGFKILDSEDFKAYVATIEEDIKAQAQAYAEATQEKDEAIAKLTEDSAAIQAQLDEVLAKASDIEARYNDLMAQYEQAQAKATETPVMPDVEVPSGEAPKETSPFADAANAMRNDVKKYNK